MRGRDADVVKPLAEGAFDVLVEQASDAVVRVSRDRVLYANAAAATLLGRDAATLNDRPFAEVDLPVVVAARLRRALRRCFAGVVQPPFVVDLDRDGRREHYALRVVQEPADGDGPRTIRVAWIVAVEVTAGRQVEQQRDALFEQQQAARANAETASQARDRFLAIVSHELRSPLNGIQSWSHVLESQLRGPRHDDTVAARALEGIRSGIDQQVKLIEHLLDATVALTGELTLAREPMVLRESIEAAVAEVRSAAIAKDVAMHVDMRLVDERMDGDPHRIRQVFTHLLSNALKFTPRGGSVWLSARCDDAKATVVVRDSGRGLSAGFEQWLFEPFEQADDSNTRRAAGIGLGLALARRLATLHGGQVWAESAGPHLGSTFTISLPLTPRPVSSRPALESSIPPRTSIELDGVTALVIDDQLEAREALSALLSQFGAIVQVAASSRDGLALIDGQGDLPDVVICDIAMPEEDGYGFARRFREYEREYERIHERDHERTRASPTSIGGARRPRTPVISLSAFVQNHRSESGANPFDFHLVKPVSPQQLLATLTTMVLGT